MNNNQFEKKFAIESKFSELIREIVTIETKNKLKTPNIY